MQSKFLPDERRISCLCLFLHPDIMCYSALNYCLMFHFFRTCLAANTTAERAVSHDVTNKDIWVSKKLGLAMIKRIFINLTTLGSDYTQWQSRRSSLTHL